MTPFANEKMIIEVNLRNNHKRKIYKTHKTLVELMSFTISHYATTCNYISFTTKLVVLATTKLILFKLWAI